MSFQFIEYFKSLWSSSKTFLNFPIGFQYVHLYCKLDESIYHQLKRQQVKLYFHLTFPILESMN